MGFVILGLIIAVLELLVYGIVFAIYSPIRRYKYRRVLTRILFPIAIAWSLIGCLTFVPGVLPHFFNIHVFRIAGLSNGSLEFTLIHFPLWLLSYLPGFALLIALVATRRDSSKPNEQSTRHVWAALSTALLLSPTLLPIGLGIRTSVIETRRQQYRDHWGAVGAKASGFNYYRGYGATTHVTFHEIKGVGLSRLEGEVEVESLDLTGTSVTDNDLIQLAALPKLYSLNLAQCNITNAGMFRISKLVELTALDLSGTNIDDFGLQYLQQLENLSSLSLQDTNVTDTGITNLISASKNLQQLDLQGTNISDAGLENLSQFHAMSRLNLGGCSVSLSEIAKLQKSLPKCLILFPGYERPESKALWNRRSPSNDLPNVE